MTFTAPARTQADRLRAIDGLADAFAARRRGYDEAAAFPAENFEALRRAGLLALTAPPEHGGDGLWRGEHYVEYYELIERLAQIDCNTAQLLQVHSHSLGILSLHASAEQKERYLGDIVRHGKLVASVGSESAPRRTQDGTYTSELVEDGDGWRLSCQKYFASLGPGADYLMLWVAVPGTGSYAERTVLVLVPRDAPEVELVDEWDVMGMRSTVSWGVKVTDLHVPADAIVGEPGGWVRNDPRTFTLGFTANHLGTAQAALDFAARWARERPHIGRSELVQLAIGDMASDVFAARSALYAAARVWEAGDYDTAELESLKALHLTKRVSLGVVQRAFEVCGARVAFRDHPLEQMYRDLRTFTLHFRDDVYTKQVGQGVIDQAFAVKGYVDGSAPIHQA